MKWKMTMDCGTVFLAILTVADLFLIGLFVYMVTKEQGNFIDADTEWYDVTIVIHYPDKPKKYTVLTYDYSDVSVGRGRNGFYYSDESGRHSVESIAPIEIVDVKRH